MSIRIKVSEYNNYPLVKVSGDLSSKTIIDVSKKIEVLANKEGCTKIIADLSEVEFIDSHGLGVFVYTWKMLEDKNKHLVLFCPPGIIRDIFIDTNLHRIVTLVDSLDKV